MPKGVHVFLGRWVWRSVAALAIASIGVSLVACGGGGGGGAGPGPDPGQPSADFTLSENSANFTAFQGGTSPAPRSFTIRVTGDTTVAISAGLASGQSQPSWLIFNVTGSGSNRTLTATVAQGALTAGQFATTLAITATSAAGQVLHQENFSVSLTVVVPVTLTATPNAFVFGGTDGRAPLTPVPLVFTLSSGDVVYPYTVTVSTTDGGHWLTVDNASGNVGGAGATADVGIDPAGLQGGVYSGQVNITVNIDGTQLVQTASVDLTLEADRLVVTAVGVGLSKLGGRAVLTRTVQVLDSLGRSGVPWTAASDSAWLSVTNSGIAGGDLVLTADPSGLPKDTTQFANVTITSPNHTIANKPSIRVGLFLSDSAPTTTAVSTLALSLATSPVEPILAISQGGASVDLYNVYSGSLVRSLSDVATIAGQVAFGEDGRTLFIYDSTTHRINQIDLQSGASVASYDASQLSAIAYETHGDAFALMHPNGYSMLITAAGRAYDLDSGGQYVATVTGYVHAQSLATSQDQTLIATQDGYTTRISRTTLNGGAFITEPGIAAPPVTVVQNTTDAQSCFSPSNDRIYTASPAPYQFTATRVATSQVIEILPAKPYPDSIQCVWNGLIVAGTSSYYDTFDIFVYDGPTGVSLGQLSSDGSPGNLHDLNTRGLAVSADGTILISSWGTPPTNTNKVTFQSLPAPPTS